MTIVHHSVPFAVILKTLAIVSLAPLLVLAALGVFGFIGITQFLLSYLAVIMGSLVFVYPFLKNMAALTHYMQLLANDKKAEQPDVNVISMVFEISDSLHALEALWERKKKDMQTVITEREILVDTLPDILIMINDDMDVVRTNRATRAIFGQNLAGKAIGDVIPNETLLDAVSGVIEDLRGREVEFRMEDPVVRDFLAIIERFPIVSEGGITIVITMNDITELKSVEQMRADFVANASHEIRTPLASIAGMVETIRGPARDDDEAIDMFLGIMAEQSERMRQLINDLLSLSKIEMNVHSVPVDPVDIAHVIRQEIRYFDLPAKEKSMSMIIDIAEELPQVKGDRNELAQIVHNLVGNAIKYGNASTDIHITAKVTTELPPDQNMRNLRRAVLVSVRDHGEGIAKEHLVRLTERFYRVDSARTREVGGTGLGLAIVKGILSRHRAAIAITSEVGEGSLFAVYLPIYND